MQQYQLNIKFPTTNKTVCFKLNYNSSYGYYNRQTALPDSDDIIYNDGAITLTSGTPNIITYSELLVLPIAESPEYGYFKIRFMADWSFLSIYNDEMAATTSGYTPYTDASIVLFTFTTRAFGLITELYANSSPTYCQIEGSITVISNVCFLGDTPINTDQGRINIESLVKNENSIKNNKIVAIAKILSSEEELIEFEKDSIEKNVPCVKTILSPLHKILYKGKMVCAKNVPEGKKIPYENQFLYNIVLKKYANIQVNNMTTETLSHSNKIADMFR
jgi:hypothetical protein